MGYSLWFKGLRLWAVSLGLLSLVACGQGESLDALQARLVTIKQKPQGFVELPPTFKSYEGFTYSASVLRSPFSLPVVVELVKSAVGAKAVHPDVSRVKEPLEAFPIESLTMVGGLQRENKKLYGLVTNKDGNVYRVQEGSYLGQNDGKIVSLSDAQINLVELMPDGAGGWVERARSLSLKSESLKSE